MLARRRRSGPEKHCLLGVCVWCAKKLGVDSRPCDGQRMGILQGDWHVARWPGNRGARRLKAQIFRERAGCNEGRTLSEGHSL